MDVKLQDITTSNTQGEQEIFVPQDDREILHINSGKREIIQTIVNSHLEGGIKETKGQCIEVLIATIEKFICFEHNKQGIAIKLDDNTLTKYFKEEEKKALGAKKERVNIPKKER